jgi:hypothetical protein
MRRDIKYKPHNIVGVVYEQYTPGLCRLLPPNHLIPTESLSYSPGGMLSLHPLCAAKHKRYPFLIHAGSVCIIYVSFSFLLSCIKSIALVSAAFGSVRNGHEMKVMSSVTG